MRQDPVRGRADDARPAGRGHEEPHQGRLRDGLVEDVPVGGELVQGAVGKTRAVVVVLRHIQ